MFKKKNMASMASGKVDTLIGKETEMNGSLKASGVVRIDGKYEGNIQTEGDLVIGESAQVQAEIKARNLTLAGRLKGNVEIDNKLEICSTGRLSGDIKVNSLVIEDGGIFEGNSTMPRNEGNKKIELNKT
ncbi:MAG: cell shape determination protein CcmA [Firmicutes bacterium HGW-Firmicutes-13]|nr:MAG: cell shape determination protein CcmA [Firmicutes bacterium HGW-Firmicutes-13]